MPDSRESRTRRKDPIGPPYLVCYDLPVPEPPDNLIHVTPAQMRAWSGAAVEIKDVTAEARILLGAVRLAIEELSGLIERTHAHNASPTPVAPTAANTITTAKHPDGPAG